MTRVNVFLCGVTAFLWIGTSWKGFLQEQSYTLYIMNTITTILFLIVSTRKHVRGVSTFWCGPTWIPPSSVSNAVVFLMFICMHARVPRLNDNSPTCRQGHGLPLSMNVTIAGADEGVRVCSPSGVIAVGIAAPSRFGIPMEIYRLS